MADRKFPRAYRDSVPQDLDNPDPMVVRVPFNNMDIGARKSVTRSIKDVNNMNISHVPDANSH
jgi:hypothetical protein